MKYERVVVTGLGIVSAAGIGAEQTWQALRRGNCEPSVCVAKTREEEVTFPVYLAPSYSLDEVEFPLEARSWFDKNFRRARDLQHLLAATSLAIADAGLEPKRSWSEDAGAIVADEHLGFESLSTKLFHLESPEGSEDVMTRLATFQDEVFGLNSFLAPYYIAKAFNLGGTCLFVNSACASGLSAMDVAADQIRRGRAKRMIVVAADDPCSLSKYLWFSMANLYATDGRLRPFDRDAAGTVFGDGGSAIVLESFSSALQRNARIYAELAGSGFAQNSWRITVSNPDSRHYLRAIKCAIEEAGIDSSSIDLFVPHAPGIPAADLLEARTMHELVGAGPWPRISGLKGYIGHNLGGSSLMETVLLLLSMSHNEIPPTANYSTPHRRFPIPVQKEWESKTIRFAVKSTSAFAGYSGAVVFASVG